MSRRASFAAVPPVDTRSWAIGSDGGIQFLSDKPIKPLAKPGFAF
ncbi:hypothetical protein SAMN05880590_11371 [Rhizobium sp. RU35A]|nr:hypothetical protein SAMN05880590_11371 [Rhizobium sp. RU35A]